VPVKAFRMAVNPWLIVVAVIMLVVCVVVNFYMLVYFQHPEDKTVAWVPKIVVV
jgi:LMBR1 domain-containing protein 1